MPKTSNKDLKPTLTVLRKIVRNLLLDPNKDKITGILSEERDSKYFIKTAIIELNRCDVSGTPIVHIKQAIRLLTFALFRMGDRG